MRLIAEEKEHMNGVKYLNYIPPNIRTKSPDKEK